MGEPDPQMPMHEAGMVPLDDAVDHVRGGSAGRLVVEYGDYECPHSRRALVGTGP